MDYAYLSNLKNDFHGQLFPILSSFINKQLKGMYKYSENILSNIITKKNKNEISLEKVFSRVLSGFETINNHEIEKQYINAKMKSGISDFFDNLVIASFKSYILFITWDPETQSSKYNDNDFFKEISVKDFIHKCHIATAKYFINNHKMFLIKNKDDKAMIDIISSCIKIAMIQMIPYDKMLSEYIENNFCNNITNNTQEISKIRHMVDNFIVNQKYGNIPKTNNAGYHINYDDYSGVEHQNNNKDVEEFIRNQKEQVRQFTDKLSNKSHNSAIEKSDQNVFDNPQYDSHSDNTVETHMSRSEEKKREISEIINKNGGTINVENDFNDNENNVIDDNNNNVDDNEDDNNDNNQNEENNQNNTNYKVLNSPPPLKSKNKLADLGVKTKLKVVSNKNSKFNSKYQEMDNYFNNSFLN